MLKAYEASYGLAKKIYPAEAAKNCDFKYEGSEKEGEFLFPFFGNETKLTFPAFSANFVNTEKELNNFLMTFVLYHLATSDGTPLNNAWISYADLPGGISYINAFRAYTCKKLVAHFDNNLEDVHSAAKKLGLKSIDIGADAAYLFDVMPKVKVAMLYRLGDEEFEPTANFLFDGHASPQWTSDC